MKRDTKIFLVLFILSLLSAILALPYTLTLESSTLSKSSTSMPVIILVSIIQSSIIFAACTFFGIKLVRKIDFKLPLFEVWLDKRKIDYKKTLLISIISGLAVGIVIILLDKLVFRSDLLSNQPPVWQGFLASFYGAFGEEILMRLFLMSLLIFIILKISRRKNPNSIMIWPSIIIIAVIFGLGHLPATSAITQITSFIILRAIVLNGIGGIVFGWLYWKKGLESAIIAHFCADIVLHVIVPAIG